MQYYYYDNGKITYSQINQDRHAMDTIFKYKHNGFFIDIGANNGVNLSNTYLMEKYYNWNGICCDCEPRVIGDLIKNRQCQICCLPIYKKTGEIVKFIVHSRSDLFSGIIGYERLDYHDNNAIMINMVTISLNDCLEKYNAPTIIDYMSIDTEGTEYEILSALDFNKYKINYIAIEHNYQEDKREKIKKLFEEHGYSRYRENKFDDDYIRNDFMHSQEFTKNTDVPITPLNKT